MTQDGPKRSKIPVWISRDAHQLLRAHCGETGQDGIQILSKLIEDNLGANKREETREETVPRGEQFGGVWLV